MPYIKKDKRNGLMKLQIAMTDTPIDNAGELNFLMTLLAISYLSQHGRRYQTMNDIVGAFDSAKAEFQRRVVAPYEDSKIEENGDVY